MSAFVVFLGGDSLPWLELEDGGVIGRGEDFREPGVTVTAIAPASSVTFRGLNSELADGLPATHEPLLLATLQVKLPNCPYTRLGVVDVPVKYKTRLFQVSAI